MWQALKGADMELGSVADWVSGAGSMVGVAVSVWLFFRSQRDTRAAAAATARNAALVVLPEFKKAERTLTWALTQLDGGRKPGFIGTDESGEDFGVGYLRERFADLEKVLPSIGLLGAAGHAAQSAYYHFRELSEDLGEYIAPDHWFDDPVTYEGEAWVATYALLKRTQEKMQRAVADMVRLLQ
ncbi:hypothetical protein LI87_0116600 [Stenotrophomonas maltophilia]|nr:hypothetical protein LI87_0116600 [Stenotrophomonas maltophilia]